MFLFFLSIEISNLLEIVFKSFTYLFDKFLSNLKYACKVPFTLDLVLSERMSMVVMIIDI